MSEERSLEGPIGARRRAMVYYVRPLVRLVILGAGNDAQPLCTLAHSLGWHVCVADRRARLATRNRFPEAAQVVAGDWWSALESITFTPQTAIVIMTHSLADDAEILPLIADRSTMYIGVLGPEHRRRWLLENAESGDLPESFRNRLRGPVGLDLGERSASGIAVSIVSEILAELNGRIPKPQFQPASSEQATLEPVAEFVRIPRNSHCR
ncbi:MAG TPA: XdhC family protein [Pirellulales bacterium]